MAGEHLKIPILAYHHILNEKGTYDKALQNSPFALTTSQFRSQMKSLANNGFTVLSFEKAVNLISGQSNNHLQNRKFAVITFDDGWLDNFENAIPILQEFDFTATFFVISGRMGSEYYMTWEQLQKIQSRGFDIESHTHSHLPLETLSALDALFELNKSKELIEARLEKRVRFLSFPHGSYSDAILKQVKQIPYEACANSKFGYTQEKANVYALPRILIRKNHTTEQIQKLCEGHTMTAFRTKWLQNSKDIVRNTIGIELYNRLYKIRYRIKRPLSLN